MAANRMQLVVFGIQNRTLGAYLTAIHRLLVSASSELGAQASQETKNGPSASNQGMPTATESARGPRPMAYLDVTVQNAMRVALRDGSKHCTHVACHLYESPAETLSVREHANNSM
jgi:hypothetical protein